MLSARQRALRFKNQVWIRIIAPWWRPIAKRWHNNWRFWDTMIALVVTFCGGAYIIRQFGIDGLVTYLDDTRSGLYQTLASIAGGLLGFVITGVSILLSFGDTPRLRAIKNTTYYKDVFLVFTATWRWLGVATVMSLLGIVVDNNAPHLWYLGVVAVSVAISIARLARSLWVLENVIDLVVVDRKASQPVDVVLPDNPGSLEKKR